jgi:phosphoribosyl 1,2-cyclic phosphodiesterase
MIGFCPLASGSKGNSIYLGTKETKILIDAGISGKQIKLRLDQIGVDISEINAVLITHEHLDHIEGLKVLSNKYNIPVFANSETAKGIYNNLHLSADFKIFTTQELFEYKDLKIFPFSILHDTLDPVGFIIWTHGLKLGFCSDLGYVSSLVVKQLQDCDYLYLEANHQVDLVHASNRPMMYKQRVLGRQGHLSNDECAYLLSQVYHPGLKHVFLAHLSSECNNPNTAKKCIENFLKRENKNIDISFAHQDEISGKIKF